MRYGVGALIVLLATTSVAAAPAAPGKLPKPVTSPATWLSQADYPPEAVRGHQEGRVGYRLEVAADGTVSHCTIVDASGSATLDAQTCQLLQDRARFEPASGVAIRTYPGRVRWTLPAVVETPPQPVEVRDYEQEREGASNLEVGADGVIVKCTRVARPYANVFAPDDLCKLFAVGTHYAPPGVRHGQPAKRRVRVDMAITESYMK
jgi:TonB family protein